MWPGSTQLGTCRSCRTKCRRYRSLKCWRHAVSGSNHHAKLCKPAKCDLPIVQLANCQPKYFGPDNRPGRRTSHHYRRLQGRRIHNGHGYYHCVAVAPFHGRLWRNAGLVPIAVRYQASNNSIRKKEPPGPTTGWPPGVFASREARVVLHHRRVHSISAAQSLHWHPDSESQSHPALTLDLTPRVKHHMFTFLSCELRIYLNPR